jgi:hypothetical protein
MSNVYQKYFLFSVFIFCCCPTILAIIPACRQAGRLEFTRVRSGYEIRLLKVKDFEAIEK